MSTPYEERVSAVTAYIKREKSINGLSTQYSSSFKTWLRNNEILERASLETGYSLDEIYKIIETRKNENMKTKSDEWRKSSPTVMYHNKVKYRSKSESP